MIEWKTLDSSFPSQYETGTYVLAAWDKHDPNDPVELLTGKVVTDKDGVNCWVNDNDEDREEIRRLPFGCFEYLYIKIPTPERQ